MCYKKEPPQYFHVFDVFIYLKRWIHNSAFALYTHCFVLRTKGVHWFFFRIALIFEVEKLKIFLLQKLAQSI
jgi:hypothetical protein